MGVKVFTVLMGQSGETRVQRGVDLFGHPLWDTGNFPVNPKLLQSMATTTGGEYFEVTDRQGLERSFHTILDHLEKSEIEDSGAASTASCFPRSSGRLRPARLELLVGTLFLRRWP